MRNELEKSSIVFFLLVLMPACSGWVRAEGGFTTATSFDAGRQGGSLGLEAAGGERDSPIALDVAIRGKATENAGDAAIYAGLLHLHMPKPIGFYVLGGANVLQLGRADGHVSFGMFSPVAELGLCISSKKQSEWGMITVGSRIEYDLRFTRQPHEGFLTFNVGYALGAGRE